MRAVGWALGEGCAGAVPTTPIVKPTTAHTCALRIAASCPLVNSTLVSRCGDGKRAACTAHSTGADVAQVPHSRGLWGSPRPSGLDRGGSRAARLRFQQ